MPTDLTVFAKDYPEARLIVELKAEPALSSPPTDDPAVKRLARAMWGAHCHSGLVMTPTHTYVLRDDFRARGPEAMRVTHVLPTGALLSRVGGPVPEQISEREFEWLARAWLEKLTTSYEQALPDDPEVLSAFFPDIVGAVAEGRLVDKVGSR